MSQVKIQGNASGTGNFTVTSPATNTDRTFTLPDETGTAATQSYVTTYASNASNLATGTVNTARLASGTPTAGTFLRGDQTWNGTVNSGTAVSPSGVTTVDFTGIPSWVKRVVVAYAAVNTSTGSNLMIRLGGASGVVSTGYSGSTASIVSTVATSAVTTGVRVYASSGTSPASGVATIAKISGNTWAVSGSSGSANGRVSTFGSSLALAEVLTTVQFLCENGTDTFTAGSVNILYEG